MSRAWALRALIRQALDGCPISQTELHRFARDNGIEDMAALRLFLDPKDSFAMELSASAMLAA